jgi:hypothetical protein
VSQVRIWKNLIYFLEGNMLGSNTPDAKNLISVDGVNGKFPCFCECGANAVFSNTKAVRNWLDQHATHTENGGPVIDFSYVRIDYQAYFLSQNKTEPSIYEESRSEKDSIMSRIEKLERLAKDNPEQNEGKAAARKADQLRKKYEALLMEIEHDI